MNGFRNNRNRRQNTAGCHDDAKERSKRRQEILSLDPDISSREDIEEEDEVFLSRLRPAPRQTETSKLLEQQNYRLQRKLQSQATGNARNLKVTRVSVRNCSSAGLKHILELLRGAVDPFRPIAPQVREADIEFYITDTKEGDALKAMNRRIADRRNRGQKLIINAVITVAPWNIVDRQIYDVIVNVLQKRYNVAGNFMDLGDFGSDQEFTSRKMLCSLSRNDVLVAVCDIIERCYNNIVALSLKANRLRSLIFPSSLVFRAKNVKYLDLADNDLSRIDELERIGLWPVEVLSLENNPLCMNYTNAETYTSDVHKHLPLVGNLDGIAVQPGTIEPDEIDKLPKAKLGYCDNNDVRDFITKFLMEYFNLFDSESTDDRKKLMAAYDGDAEFTFSINTLENHPSAKGDYEVYQYYLRGSRNIVFEDRWNLNPDRVRYKGAMDIAVQLAKLPSTFHVQSTFLLDVNFYMDNVCSFTLRGLFRDGKERNNDRAPHKMFMRNFLVQLVAENQMAILCDTLQVCPVSKNLADGFRDKLAAAANGNTQVPVVIVTAPPPTPRI